MQVRRAELSLPPRREPAASVGSEPSGAATSAADDSRGGEGAPTIDWGPDLEGAGEGGPAIQWDLDEADLVLEDGGDAGDPSPLGTSAGGAAPLEVNWDVGVCSWNLPPPPPGSLPSAFSPRVS